MLRLLADQNFNRNIVRGLSRRTNAVDVVRVQDVGLSRAKDEDVLEWAAREGRMVATHDVSTMVGFAYQRVRAGLPMPGLVEVARGARVGRVIEDLLVLEACSSEGEWEGQVIYLPL